MSRVATEIRSITITTTTPWLYMHMTSLAWLKSVKCYCVNKLCGYHSILWAMISSNTLATVAMVVGTQPRHSIIVNAWAIHVHVHVRVHSCMPVSNIAHDSCISSFHTYMYV